MILAPVHVRRRRTMNDPLRLPGPEQIGGRTGPGEVRSDGSGRGEVHRVLPIDPGDLVPVPLGGEQQVGSEESTHARNEDHRRSVRTTAPDEAASADLVYGALGQEDSASLSDRGLVRARRSPLTGRCRLARTPSRRRPRRVPRNTPSRASRARPGIRGGGGGFRLDTWGGAPPPARTENARPAPRPLV